MSGNQDHESKDFKTSIKSHSRIMTGESLITLGPSYPATQGRINEYIYGAPSNRNGTVFKKRTQSGVPTPKNLLNYEQLTDLTKHYLIRNNFAKKDHDVMGCNPSIGRTEKEN